MKYALLLILLSLKVSGQIVTVSFPNTIEMRNEDYYMQSIPYDGSVAVVGQTRKNGIVINKQLYYRLISNNTSPDDSLNVVIPDYYVDPAYAWVLDTGVAYAVPKDTVSWMGTKTDMSAKENTIPTGTTSQYYRGDKTWQTLPSAKYLTSLSMSGAVNKIITAYMNNGDTVQTPVMKIPVTYSGTTNSSGIYAVTFGTAYSVAPNIQANVVGGNNKWTLIPTVTTTGFSIYVQNRVDVLGLLPSYQNVNGASVDVIITEK